MRRKNSEIDKAFTDRAWSEMKAMLDREMPVEKDEKKPVFWWWLSGALVAGLIIGVVGMWYVDQGDDLQPNPPSENGVEQPLPASAPVAANVPKSDESTSEAFTEGKFERKNEALNSEVSGYTTAVESLARNPLSPVSILPEATEQLATSSETTVSETEQGPARESLSAIELEKQATQVLLKAADPELALSIPHNSAAPKIKSFYLAAQHNLPSGGFGFAAGMQRHFPLGNSRWSLGLGAGYAYLQRPLYIRQTDTLAANSALEIANAEYGFEQINADLFSASEAITTNRRQDLAMHYLELPVSVSRSFGGRFGLSAGLTPSILLATAPELTSGGLFRSTVKIEAAEDMQPGNLPAPSDAATLVPVNGFDLKINGGLYYRLSPTWKLALSYEHGLSDVLEGNSTKEYHRLLRLGVHYNVATR